MVLYELRMCLYDLLCDFAYGFVLFMSDVLMFVYGFPKVAYGLCKSFLCFVLYDLCLVLKVVCMIFLCVLFSYGCEWLSYVCALQALRLGIGCVWLCTLPCRK